MAEPRGHTLLTHALGVINRTVEARRHESPWREIVARTTDRARTFVVAIHDDLQPLEHHLIEVHAGRFRVVGQVGSEAAAHWRIAVDHLRQIAAEPGRFLEDPGKLEMRWLEHVLREEQERPRREPSGLRPGRPRRTPRHAGE